MTASQLHIPIDPNEWAPADLLRWLQMEGVRLDVHAAALPPDFDGRRLANLPLAEWSARFPHDGSRLLRAELRVWQLAACYRTNSFEAQRVRAEILQSYDDPPWPSNQSEPQTPPVPPAFDQSTVFSQHLGLPPISSVYSAPPQQFADGFCSAPGRSLSTPDDPYAPEWEDVLSVITGDSGSNSTAHSPIKRMPARRPRRDRLWHYIRMLLDSPERFGAVVQWKEREEGTWKIESSQLLADMWGAHKNCPEMSYDKLSRTLRSYYDQKILLKPASRQRLVYQFAPYYRNCRFTPSWFVEEQQ
ncbi:DNA-binding protein D-ETS-4 [Aphelenchoides fujianensis]|nr:DNA-binding protein D-ETS-4 [Aphelenchoides fujianensis]